MSRAAYFEKAAGVTEMLNGKLPITAVVPVKNEELNLPRCLAALVGFERVIVVDSASTDRTVEIAQAAGAEVLQFQWNGRFPKKRNWVLQSHIVTTPWVLFIDADEVIDDKFCAEVRTALTTDDCAGYWLNYSIHFLGRQLRHGVPQRKLALFRTGSGTYERIDEERWSKLDMEVHEHPVIEGRIGEINAAIEHRDFRGIDKHLERHRDYALWEARRARLLEETGKTDGGELTQRQRLKYANLSRWWYPWAYFIYAYIIRLGFLDGAAGFYYAFYKAWYFLTVRLMVRELKEAQRA